MLNSLLWLIIHQAMRMAATNRANTPSEFAYSYSNYQFVKLFRFLHFILYIMKKTFSFEKIFVVEHTGFEPVTSTMRM